MHTVEETLFSLASSTATMPPLQARLNSNSSVSRLCSACGALAFHVGLTQVLHTSVRPIFVRKASGTESGSTLDSAASEDPASGLPGTRRHLHLAPLKLQGDKAAEAG